MFSVPDDCGRDPHGRKQYRPQFRDRLCSDVRVTVHDAWLDAKAVASALCSVQQDGRDPERKAVQNHQEAIPDSNSKGLGTRSETRVIGLAGTQQGGVT